MFTAAQVQRDNRQDKVASMQVTHEIGDLNWDDLRYVLAVADAGSLAAAARTLRVELSTVLRRLNALERRLQVRLFDRHRSGYAPTDAGELLAEQAQRMRSGLDEARRRIVGRDLELSGSVRLTAPHIAMDHLLPEPLAAFARAHPRIEVDVAVNSALADLSKREADVALRLSPSLPEHLIARKVGEMRLRVYALRGAKGLPQRRTPIARLVGSAPWIGFDAESRMRFFDRWMDEMVSPDRVRLRVDLLNSMAAMLRTGLGIGLLPSFIERSESDLIAVSDDIDGLSVPVSLLTHPDLRRTARIRVFVQEVGDAIATRLAEV